VALFRAEREYQGKKLLLRQKTSQNQIHGSKFIVYGREKIFPAKRSAGK
jgi:hypothetical protein